MRLRTFVALLAMLLIATAAPAVAADKLIIGVALHPYYSWALNIVGDRAEVRTVIPPDSDPHSYQPRAEDLANLSNLDVVIFNGLGHDQYLEQMIQAAGRTDMPLIRPNQGLPLIPVFRETYELVDGKPQIRQHTAYNSHSYIAILGAIQQINTIARELGNLDPPNASYYRSNARAYNRRLRNMLGNALDKINEIDAAGTTLATVHDGYAYLFQELGLNVSAVIQPRHGIEPSARQLADTIEQIKSKGITILFAELDYDKKYVDIIFQETGCRIYQLSHISHGEFSPEKFERDMQANLDSIIKALSEAR
ncbi:MAG: zinc ABC transporter substrate-binding protein [Candidatus Alcyoniella australis]|nr:zinc ABC transporter substrate-binding protein [Candidatus Alcyoniella australis]